MANPVLVTGGTGFTGSHLCQRLLKKEIPVRALVRVDSDYRKLESLGCDIYFGDLASGEGVESAVQGVEKVFHIGAAFRIEGVPHKYFWNVNVEGTRKLMDASLKYDIKRFVHCSTVGVQGEIENPPATEEDPYNPGDHYQESKVDGEQLVLSYAKKGLEVTVFRPAGIYGPGDTRFLKLFRPISKGRWFIVGEAANLYQLTYIDDLISGILLCGDVSGINGEVFTLAGDRACTVKELGRTIARVLDTPLKIYKIPVAPVWVAALLLEVICPVLRIKPPLYRRRLDFFLKDRAFDTSKARNVLNFKPAFSLEEGIRKTAQWYKEQGLL